MRLMKNLSFLRIVFQFLLLLKEINNLYIAKDIWNLSCLVDCAKFNFEYILSRYFCSWNSKIITAFQRNKYFFFYSKHAKLIVSYLILKKRGRISDTAAGFPWQAAIYRTRSAPSALQFVPRCLQSVLSRRPKLCFGREK